MYQAIRAIDKQAIPSGAAEGVRTLDLPASGGAFYNLSGRWDSHPRPSRWQRDILLLNYARFFADAHQRKRTLLSIFSKYN